MRRQHRIIASLALAAWICTAGLTSCSDSQIRTLARGIDSATSEIFKEYEEIVIDGNPRPNFTAQDKEYRKASLRKVRELLEQALR